MYDTGKIIVGLVVFLILATSPLWFNMLTAETSEAPEVQILPKAGKTCVEATEYMRSDHMDLLNDWRDQVVREGVRDYTNAAGETFDMSLSRTCMEQCHTNKAEFCDACHTYTAVTPYCWDCHVEPKEAQ
jgi:hypothetical protein